MATIKKSLKKPLKKTAAITSKPAAASKKTNKTAAVKKAVKPEKKTVSAPKKAAAAPAKKSIQPEKKKLTKPAPKSLQTAKKPAAAAPKKKSAQPPKELKDIKMLLLRQRAAILNEAETALNELPGQTIFPDLGDQASAETDRNFMLRLRGREQRLLKKIEEAIERIENGTYGICEDCGNEIGIKRLSARPVTTMCIECKTLQEEEEKLRES